VSVALLLLPAAACMEAVVQDRRTCRLLLRVNQCLVHDTIPAVDHQCSCMTSSKPTVTVLVHAAMCLTVH
jgi:hypothetical protein